MVVAGAAITGLNAVIHRVAPYSDVCSEAIISNRRHFGNVGRFVFGDRFQIGRFHDRSTKLYHHFNRIALSDDLIASLRLNHENLRVGNTRQVRSRRERPQKQAAQPHVARKHQHHECNDDHSGKIDVALDQSDGQKRLHLDILHPARNVLLQQLSELRGVKNVAFAAAQLDCR